MSTITIQVSDEAEAAAKSLDLSVADFAQLALAQSLARTLRDPQLESRANQATNDGWERLKSFIPNARPLPGDEMP